MSATVSQSTACSLLLHAQVDFHWTRSRIKIWALHVGAPKSHYLDNHDTQGTKKMCEFLLAITRMLTSATTLKVVILRTYEYG